MGRQAIFLSDEKDDDGLRLPVLSCSPGSEPKLSSTPIRVFVKWALIFTLIVLAMTFTSELFEPQGSKARRSLGKPCTWLTNRCGRVPHHIIATMVKYPKFVRAPNIGKP